MYRRCNNNVYALGCKHQRSKAGKKVDKAADGKHVPPIDNRR